MQKMERKREREEEFVKIEIEYVRREPHVPIRYDKNERVLSIVATAGQKMSGVELDREVPDRENIKAILENLSPKYPPATVLKASYAIDGSGIATFINMTAWEIFQIDEKGYVEDIPDSVVLIGVLVPMLTYKDVQALEQFSEMRELIFTFNVWQKLFKRDFPEIYHPDVFFDEVEPPLEYVKILNDMSKAGGRPRVDKRPYWKLLYEYQLRNKFEVARDLPHTTTFYGYMSLKINIKEEKMTFSPFLDERRLPPILSSPVCKLIKEGKCRAIIFFEMNLDYVFIVGYVRYYHRLFVLSDMKGAIVSYLDVRGPEEILGGGLMGLIGAKGCFYQNADRSETTLVYNGRKTTYTNREIIHVCYNTRSECFMLETKELGFRVYRLFEIRDNEPYLLRNGDPLLDMFTHVTTFNDKWIIASSWNNDLLNDNDDFLIEIQPQDGKLKFITVPHRVLDMCIVGDYLYVCCNFYMRIYNLSKENHSNFKEYQCFRNYDFVRMSFMGPVFFTQSGWIRISGLLYSDSATLRLVGQSVCTGCENAAPQYLCGNQCGAQYCGEACQTQDWKNRHSLICGRGGGGRRQRKIHKVMTEFKEGRLKTSAGKTVTDRKQAIAIALSEANELK